MKWNIPINEGGAVDLVGRVGEVEIEIIANRSQQGNTIVPDGAPLTKNAGGRLLPKQLQEFGRDFLRQRGNGATELILRKAPRTTGAILERPPPPISIKLE